VLLDVARWLHIASGALALGALFVPLLARKGGRAHRAVGRVYVRAMNGVAGTGVVLAAAKLGDPATRDGGIFLLYVGLLAATTTAHGDAALRHKGRVGPVREFDTVGFPALLAVAGLAMVARALVAGDVLPAAFGAIGISTGLSALRYWLGDAHEGWLHQHIGGMIASAIGTVTAFSVVNADRFGLPVPGWVVWLAPTMIGVPAMQLWQRAWAPRSRSPQVARPG
jgi:uncharacterized membrane protein